MKHKIFLYFAIAILLFSTQTIAQTPELISIKTEDGGEIYANLYGKSERGLVLAHGGRFNKESWAKQIPEFVKAGFRVIAIDFRGYGKSTGPMDKDVMSAPLHHEVLAAVRYLKANGAKSVSIVGGSMGAGAASDAVIESAPGEINSLVALGGFVGWKPVEKIKCPLLIIMTRDDKNSEGLRLPNIQKNFDKAPKPKKLVLLDGDAHAQFMFDDAKLNDKVMKKIIKFLKKNAG